MSQNYSAHERKARNITRFSLQLATICLSLFSLPAFAQDYYPSITEGYATQSLPPTQDDLPRVRSLGKLVSIEGRPGDPGSLRPVKSTVSQDDFETGSELDYDPESSSDDFKLPKLSYFYQEPYTNYRSNEDSTSFMPGDGEQFGWLSWESTPYIKRGYDSGFSGGFGMHLLGGPISSPLPPRLYDFTFGYQKRGRIQDFMSYDLATTIGVFSDFEDSARDGIRLPGHAVGMLHLKPELDVVFGIDYLDRDDIKLLPVGGVSWRPQSMQDVRVDFVFPRPRIDYSIDNRNKVYVAGKLGGGSWDIEFPNNDNDVMTYRDVQLLFGYESQGTDGELHMCEFGWVFDRRLEFRTLTTETEFGDAFVFRIVTKK